MAILKPSGPSREADANRLARLFHNRWAMPVMAVLHEGGGAKFVTLHRRLDVGRDTLSRTLSALGQSGWAMRNPGHGHPMRPEYILTEKGTGLGKACADLHTLLVKEGQSQAFLKKWSPPALLALEPGPRRFQELAGSLHDATPRALTQSLKALIEADLVARTLLDTYPPRPVYALTRGAGRLIAPLRRSALALEDACAA